MTLKVGITGNIGSGKTTVCRLFEILRVPVLYADILAKRLMTERLGMRHELVELLGSDIYNSDGELNRKLVADMIFHDEEKRKNVNRVVHSGVQDYLRRWFDVQEAKYAIEEAALIYESGGHHYLDEVIVVDAPEAMRFERVMKRDGVDEDAVRAREKSQWPARDKVDKADYVIINDGQQSLIEQVMKIHRTLAKV